MNRWIASLSVLMALVVALIQPTAAGANPPTSGTEQYYKEALGLLDTLEHNNPRDHALFFKLRINLDKLFLAPVPSQTTARSTRPAPDYLRLGEQAGDLYANCYNLSGRALVEALQRVCGNQIPIGYQGAQEAVFTRLDNHEGQVECVYTGRKLTTDCEPPATNMNIEHSWPQSQGAVGEAKSDLHHLFPTDSKANNLRSSYPFGNVSRPTWEQGGSKFDGKVFEIRPEQRGNTARAMFYFAVRYNKTMPPAQEQALRAWNKEDPVDQAERDRNDRIENIQHNRNPFVDHPEFVDLIQEK